MVFFVMEANLNQFRLLTVHHGDQEVNCRRGSTGAGRLRPLRDGRRKSTAVGEADSMNGSATRDCGGLQRRRSYGRQRAATLDVHTEVQVSDDADAHENDATEADRGEAATATAADPENSLISALKSLERTLTDHTQQMTKRLRRELTVKGANSETAAQRGVDASSEPAKTALRGDKVYRLDCYIINTRTVTSETLQGH